MFFRGSNDKILSTFWTVEHLKKLFAGTNFNTEIPDMSGIADI